MFLAALLVSLLILGLLMKLLMKLLVKLLMKHVLFKRLLCLKTWRTCRQSGDQVWQKENKGNIVSPEYLVVQVMKKRWWCSSSELIRLISLLFFRHHLVSLGKESRRRKDDEKKHDEPFQGKVYCLGKELQQEKEGAPSFKSSSSFHDKPVVGSWRESYSLFLIQK